MNKVNTTKTINDTRALIAQYDNHAPSIAVQEMAEYLASNYLLDVTCELTPVLAKLFADPTFTGDEKALIIRNLKQALLIAEAIK